MLDKPKHDLIESTSHLLAGEKFSANKQCELIFGEGTKNCPFTVTVSMHGRNYESVSGWHASLRVPSLTNTLYNHTLYTVYACDFMIFPVMLNFDRNTAKSDFNYRDFCARINQTDPLLVL